MDRIVAEDGDSHAHAFISDFPFIRRPATEYTRTAPHSPSWQSLRARGVKIRCAARSVMVAQGDALERGYEVVAGSILLTRYSSDGVRHIVHVLVPGDTFGIIEAGASPYSAETSGGATVLSYRRKDIDTRLAADPAQCIALAAQRIEGLERRVELLSYFRAKPRVAAFLCDLASRQAAAANDLLSLPMNRQDLAQYLGLTPESVCRTLQRFKIAGLIAVPSVRQIKLLQRRALQDLCLEPDV